MVVIKVMGGLGNQMFQYSLYRQFQLKGVKAKLDVRGSDIECIGTQNDNRYNKSGFIINDIFDVECSYANDFDANIAMYFPAFFGPAKNEYNYYREYLRTSGFSERLFSEQAMIDGCYHKIKHGYLWGYWQCPLHLEGIMDSLRKDFTFKLPLDYENSEVAKKIQNTNSVSIHVRRGDYIRLFEHFYILGRDYYKKAIEQVLKTQQDVEFFVFSDDIPWCQHHLGLENATYVDGNYGNKNYIDMQLMSLCKHNIIANSTFSLWGALLNNNPEKVVVSPKNFFKQERDLVSKMLPKQFIQIDNKDELE